MDCCVGDNFLLLYLYCYKVNSAVMDESETKLFSFSLFLFVDWFVLIWHAGLVSEMCAVLLDGISFTKTVSSSTKTCSLGLD